MARQLGDGVFDGHPILHQAAIARLLDDLRQDPARGAIYDRVLNIVASIGILQAAYQPAAPT